MFALALPTLSSMQWLLIAAGVALLFFPQIKPFISKLTSAFTKSSETEIDDTDLDVDVVTAHNSETSDLFDDVISHVTRFSTNSARGIGTDVETLIDMRNACCKTHKKESTA